MHFAFASCPHCWLSFPTKGWEDTPAASRKACWKLLSCHSLRMAESLLGRSSCSCDRCRCYDHPKRHCGSGFVLSRLCTWLSRLAPFAKAVLEQGCKDEDRGSCRQVIGLKRLPIWLWKTTGLRLCLLTRACHMHSPGAGYDNIDLKASSQP